MLCSLLQYTYEEEENLFLVSIDCFVADSTIHNKRKERYSFFIFEKEIALGKATNVDGYRASDLVQFFREVPHFPAIKKRSCESVTAGNVVLPNCTESTGEDMENEPVREP